MSTYGADTTTTASGPCPGCSSYFSYDGGDGWTDPYGLARFIIDCILLATVLALLLHSCITVRRPNNDLPGRASYIGALVTTLCYFALNILNRAFEESYKTLSYAYYSILAFFIFFYVVPIVLIVGILAYIARLPRVAIIAIITILSLVAAGYFAFSIRVSVYQVNDLSDDFGDLIFYYFSIINILDLVFNALCLLALFAIVPALLSHARNYSTITAMFTTLACLALIVQCAVAVALDALYTANTSYDYSSVSVEVYIAVAPILEDVTLALALVFLFVAYINSHNQTKGGAYAQPLQVSQYQNGVHTYTQNGYDESTAYNGHTNSV